MVSSCQEKKIYIDQAGKRTREAGERNQKLNIFVLMSEFL